MADDQTQGMDPSGTTLPSLPGMSQDQLARRRAMAQALISQGVDFSPVQSKWQGAARLADALVGSLQMNAADRAETTGRQQMISALSKGGDISTVGKALAASPYGSQTGIDLLTQNLINQNKYRAPIKLGAGETLLSPTTYQPVAQGAPKPSVGDVELDKKFGADLEQWSASGGYAEVESNLDSLQHAVDTLNSKQNISGPVVGLAVRQPRDSILGAAAAAKYPDAFDVAERHKRAVTASMRQILGSQRAEKLIDEVVGATYDPSLPQEVNANRLGVLIKNLKTAAAAKDRAAQYFSKNGTLKGYQGVVPENIGDVVNAPTAAMPASAAPPVPGANQMNVSATGNARPIPTYDTLQNLKAHAADPQAKQAFDKYYGAGAADHFLAGGQ